MSIKRKINIHEISVTEFTKKTGDYYSLSAVDLRVIALTYHLEKEFTGGKNIRDKPLGSVNIIINIIIIVNIIHWEAFSESS